ncbi:hypothetical protein [Paenibacillus sp. GYB003]|uniref:hypothetical protein n=1 Tax=Paenibacillus sp. GYB003 TaxID=2994392 RepID=UPI002F96CFB6
MSKPAEPRIWNKKFPHISSVAAGADGTVYASSLGRGVYAIDSQGDWRELVEQWPAGATVNRLAVIGGSLTACTSDGIYRLREGCWESTDIAVPAYQLRVGEGGTMLAATQYGLWRNLDDGWSSWAYAESVVYDLLYLPGFIIAGFDRGIALYDRLTGEWAEFGLRVGVTSLGVYRGCLVGSGENGQLVVGTKRGGFAACGFDGLVIMGLIQKGRDLYVCSDKGLFRLGLWRDRVTLLPVRLGFPVADADWIGDTMVVATLFRGIQLVEKESGEA